MDKTELSVIFLGFGIVFSVLAILFLVMVVMNLLSTPRKGKAPAAAAAAVPAAQAAVPSPTPGEDDAETAAAITAALAVVMDVPVSAVRLTSFYERTAHPTHYIVDDPWNPAGRAIEAWRPKYKNTDGGNRDEKLYSKDKWKNL